MSTTINQLKKRIAQLNSLIAKFPTVRSLIRKWVFELVVLEGKLEALPPLIEPVQLTIWDVKPMLEIVHSRTYEMKDYIKGQGCKWNPSKKAWIAPSQDIYDEIMAKLEEKEEADTGFRNRFYGQCGFDGIGVEEIDNFLNSQASNLPSPQPAINYTPTMGDALRLFGEEQVNRYWDEKIPSEASKILASGETNETEIFDRLNYNGMKGKSVDMLIDIVKHIRQNPPGVNKEPVCIELRTYRNKNLNAYLAPVVNGKADYSQNLYGEPIDEDAKDRAHRGKKHTVRVQVDNLLDGVYVWKEAGGADGNKARYGWIKVVAGQIVDEGEGKP